MERRGEESERKEDRKRGGLINYNKEENRK